MHVMCESQRVVFGGHHHDGVNGCSGQTHAKGSSTAYIVCKPHYVELGIVG
jgi:hypothetical protein